jgi:cobalt/nickel transport system permease protein
MHIPDGYLSPTVCAVTGLVAVGGLAWAIRQLDHQVHSRSLPLTGMVAALVFAGQMVNFPLGLFPVSGHLIGATLAAILLGPWGGCVAISLVLLIQLFLFADGGWLALGANSFNMAVVGALGGGAVFDWIRRMLPGGGRRIVIAGMLAAWVSVMAASTCFCLELALSGQRGEYSLGRLWLLMTLFQSLIGVGEALVTGLVLGVVQQQRSDLLDESASPAWAGPLARCFWTGLALALFVAAFLSPLASRHPDGLEAAAERAGLSELAQTTRSLWLDDYSWKLPLGSGMAGDWRDGVATAAAGIVGTLIVGCLGWLISSRIARPFEAETRDLPHAP